MSERPLAAVGVPGEGATSDRSVIVRVGNTLQERARPMWGQPNSLLVNYKRHNNNTPQPLR
jgi:hypothetical protein